MPKRKHGKEATEPTSDGDVEMKTGSGPNDSDSGPDEDFTEVPVSFEWFDPQPAHDFHGLRVLLRQLFDADSSLFDLSSLTDLILSQPLVGTTIKLDGNESDPVAFLTVLNANLHSISSPAFKTLIDYLLEKSKTTPELHDAIHKYLAASSDGIKPGGLGLILTERLINLPTEIVPPMYKMILEEIQWALEDKEPYDFGAFLIVSKTYTEIPSQLDADENADENAASDEELERPKAKKFKSRMRQIPATLNKSKKEKGKERGKGMAGGGEVNFFHPEDEVIQKYALAHGGFKYTKEKDQGAADSKRTFSDYGILPAGSMILLERSKLPKVAKRLEEEFKPF
ncbi:p21-C-terminal region-binding protein-domain-containing protein [Kalaharituber pfeilii]|nr:p21-C-terminal region-binding protein-domain-containing protein [Kalaharituber pfeilii]